MQRKNIRHLLAAAIIVCVRAAQGNAADRKIESPLNQDVVAITQKNIEVTSLVPLDYTISNITQRRALAREAATVQAQAKMIAVINSLRGDAGRPGETAGDLPANRHLQRAKVVKTRWTDDNRCGVTLKLNKREYEKLTGTKLRGRL